MKLQSRITAVFDAIINLLTILAAAIVIFMMLGIVTEVLFRYFGGSILWMFEVSEYSLLFMTFLGAAWLLRREGHVKMEIILDRLNLRNQTLVNITTSIIGAIICSILTWYGAKVSWEHFQMGYFLKTTLEPLTFPILAVIPVGSFLLVIQFLRRSYHYIERWRAS